MSTIHNLSELHFFSDLGSELHTEREYTISWTFVPSPEWESHFVRVPSGHFECGLKTNANGKDTIDVSSFDAYVDDGGELLLGTIDDLGTWADGEEIPYTQEYYEALLNSLFDANANIEINVKCNGTTYTRTVPMNKVFTYQSGDNDEYMLSWRHDYVYTGSDEGDAIYRVSVISFPLVFDSSNNPYVLDILVNGLGIELFVSLFPYIRYVVGIQQEKASTSFMAANTMLVLQADYDENGNERLTTPYLTGADDQYDLLFTADENGELKFLELEDDVYVNKSDYRRYVDLYKNETPEASECEPISIPFCVQSDTEGCYSNHIYMYIVRKADGRQQLRFMGVIAVRTEIEGEDERYMAIFNNLGVPEPARYATIFSESEFDEELPDYTLVNKKSKELYLTYDQIFPFSGTYKALINAVKFLGYQDIVFKEWYRLYTYEDQLKDVAVQVVNMDTGEMLKSALAEYNVSIEDYDYYTKLNKLSMIYHLNELESDSRDADLQMSIYKPTQLYSMCADYISELDATVGDGTGVGTDDLLHEFIQYVKAASDDKIDAFTEAYVKCFGKQSADAQEQSKWEKDAANRRAKIRDYIGSTTDTVLTKYGSSEHGLMPVGFSVNSELTFYYNSDDEKISAQTNAYFENASTGRKLLEADVPLVKPLFEYRKAETVAKLHAVKDWLEHYIIGVNAYISDITAEGVVVEKMKTQAYATQHVLLDLETYGHFTPVITGSTDFINSTSTLNCTLAEFKGASFNDYYDVKVMQFVKQSLPTGDPSIPYMHVSNSFECPVLGDEYEFQLSNTPASSSLYEFTDASSSQAYLYDNVLTIMDDGKTEVVFDNLPIISLEHANIRKTYGKWDRNIMYVVKEVIDADTGAESYRIKNRMSGQNEQWTQGGHIRMVPFATNASFKYTENNKWHLPMFVATGYKFIGDFGDGSFDFGGQPIVLDILRGNIQFYDANTGIHADLTFVDEAEDMYVGDLPREQQITVTYYTDSIRTPFLEVKLPKGQSLTDAVIAGLNAGVNTANEMVENLNGADVVSGLLETLYDKSLLITIENADDNVIPDAKDIATESVNEYLQAVKNAVVDSCKWDGFISAYCGVTKSNTSINVDVHRLGEYQATVKAYDSTNSTFVNSTGKTYTVRTDAVPYSIVMSQAYSSNDETFYPYNKNGDYVDFSDLMESVTANSVPVFPKKYAVYDIYTDKNSCFFKYDVLSYALPLPSNNDYMILSNLTEVATFSNPGGPDVDGSTCRLTMLDENPGRQNFYRNDTSVCVCVLDELKVEDVSVMGPFRVLDFNLQDPSTDVEYSDQSYIDIDAGDALADYAEELYEGRYKAYVIDVTRYPICGYANDESNKTCTLSFGQNCDMFNTNDVIKIIYRDNSESAADGSTVINETAYRIISIDGDDYNVVINGLIDSRLASARVNGNIYESDLLGSGATVSLTASYPYSKPVHYMVRVDEGSQEYWVNEDNDYRKTVQEVYYNNNQLFANDYIDDTFRCKDYDFDVAAAKNAWWTPSADMYADYSQMAAYKYDNYPVTVNVGKNLVFMPDEDDAVDMEGAVYKWTWKCTTFDDDSNWSEHTNNLGLETWLECTNKCMTVTATNLGVNDIALTVVDKYGNTITTENTGRVYVTDQQTIDPDYCTSAQTADMSDQRTFAGSLYTDLVDMYQSVLDYAGDSNLAGQYMCRYLTSGNASYQGDAWDAVYGQVPDDLLKILNARPEYVTVKNIYKQDAQGSIPTGEKIDGCHFWAALCAMYKNTFVYREIGGWYGDLMQYQYDNPAGVELDFPSGRFNEYDLRADFDAQNIYINYGQQSLPNAIFAYYDDMLESGNYDKFRSTLFMSGYDVYNKVHTFKTFADKVFPVYSIALQIAGNNPMMQQILTQNKMDYTYRDDVNGVVQAYLNLTMQ